MVFILVLKKEVMFELIFSDIFGLENDCKWLDQGAIIVDDLNSNEGLEDISEMNSEPTFKFDNSNGEFLNIEGCTIFTQSPFHFPVLIILNFSGEYLVDTFEAAIELGFELDVVPG